MIFSTSSKAAANEGRRRIIFVEGQDDAWFIDKLLEELQADPKDVGVIFLEGNGALDKELRLLLKSSGYVQRKTLGIAFLLDADADAAATSARLVSFLEKQAIPGPEHGSIAPYDEGRVVGIYIFPDGTQPGELEDLLLKTVQSDDRLTIVTSALSTVEDKYGKLPKRSKRVARMYLSVLDIKPCGIGRAYCENVFTSDHADVNNVRQFLKAFIA